MLNQHMSMKYAHEMHDMFEASMLDEAGFLLELAEKHKGEDLITVLREYVELAKEKTSNLVIADVTTALPLTADQEQRLSGKLCAITGRNIKIRHRIDSDILGGIVVRVGDKLLDGSVSHQLSVLQADLLKSPLMKVGVTD